MKISLLVTNRNEHFDPTTQKVIRVVNVMPAPVAVSVEGKPATPVNDGLFEDNKGGVNLSLNNVSEEAFAKLPPGTKLTLTTEG